MTNKVKKEIDRLYAECDGKRVSAWNLVAVGDNEGVEYILGKQDEWELKYQIGGSNAEPR